MDAPERRGAADSRLMSTPNEKTVTIALPPNPVPPSTPAAPPTAGSARIGPSGSGPPPLPLRGTGQGQTMVGAEVPPSLAAMDLVVRQAGTAATRNRLPEIVPAAAPRPAASPVLVVASSVILVALIAAAAALYGIPRAGSAHGASSGAVPASAVVDTSAPAAAPLVSQAPALDGPGAELSKACLRDHTQTIDSRRRDEILLEAITKYENGQRERARALLKEYTQEACDQATLNALLILDRLSFQESPEH